MARVTVEDCLDKVDNRFALVLLVSKRSKQLLKGSQPTLNAKSNKYVVTALREVASGSVYFDNSAMDAETRRSEVEKDLNR